MQPQLRQHLAGVKAEVLHEEVALLRLRRIGRLRAEGAQQHDDARHDGTVEGIEAHVQAPALRIGGISRWLPWRIVSAFRPLRKWRMCSLFCQWPKHRRPGYKQPYSAMCGNPHPARSHAR